MLSLHQTPRQPLAFLEMLSRLLDCASSKLEQLKTAFVFRARQMLCLVIPEVHSKLIQWTPGVDLTKGSLLEDLCLKLLVAAGVHGFCVPCAKDS